MGLSHQLFGARLLPIGTLYDPFIARGLDALNYACYQDARFMVVATPSGVTLAPEGGAHQSIHTPLIGIGQPGLLSYEPTYVDELAVLMRHGLDYMQQDKGGSVYLRLSTRSLPQPPRTLTPEQEADIVAGGYWYAAPEPGSDIAIVAMGAVTPEAIAAHESVVRDFAGAGLLVLTSPDRLHADWLAAQRNRGRTAGVVDRQRRTRRTPAGAAVTRCPAGHRARRPSAGAVLAGLGARPSRRAARHRELRPVGRHSRPLSRLQARCGGDHRRGRAVDLTSVVLSVAKDLMPVATAMRSFASLRTTEAALTSPV